MAGPAARHGAIDRGRCRALPRRVRPRPAGRPRDVVPPHRVPRGPRRHGQPAADAPRRRRSRAVRRARRATPRPRRAGARTVPARVRQRAAVARRPHSLHARRHRGARHRRPCARHRARRRVDRRHVVDGHRGRAGDDDGAPPPSVGAERMRRSGRRRRAGAALPRTRRHRARRPSRGRRLVRRDGSRGPLVLRPLRDFLHTEASGGVALLLAAVVALLWANSPWQDGYHQLWSTRIAIEVGGHGIDLDLRHWINDGLMAIFFFVVGLEIKRELVEGELRDPRRAALPAIAAVGGMVAPALIYAAFNAGGAGSSGWGIPVATDIAVVVGVVALLGSAVHPALKLFLLALAIVDDIGAIAIIAVALLGIVVACRAAGVRAIGLYVVLGVAVWLAVHESGIHATITGVALG